MDSQPRISPLAQINAQAVRNLQAQTAREEAMQIDSMEDLSQYFDVNPLLQAQRFRGLNDLKNQLIQGSEETENPEDKPILKVEKAEETAQRFARNNEELDPRILLILRSRLAGKPNREEILEKTLETYGDPALADEALDFLIETAEEGSRPEFQKAKEQLNERYTMEIRAGRNMGEQARAFSKDGLGSPISLRELYRDILNHPREATVLFDEMAERFPYPKLVYAVNFLFQSLGKDFRSKGPSIPRGELKRLIDESRSLQAMLGVFRFFQSRMPLIHSFFARNGMSVPLRLNFEMLARVFIKILNERFINPERILMSASVLGISEDLLAQIIVYMQMRDAIRQISLRYYRNPKHKEEILKSFIDTIEKLEKEKEEKEKKEKENS